MERDWREWHAEYDDPSSRLARRLAIVQQCIRNALDSMAPGPIRVVSMCAGEGRDLLGVLADHPRASDVTGRLVELDPELAARAAARAPVGIEVVCGDASTSDVYTGAVPADLVLVCGVFGNISDADVEHTVRTLASLCAPGATAIWTRHRREPDLTVSVPRVVRRGRLRRGGVRRLRRLPVRRRRPPPRRRPRALRARGPPLHLHRPLSDVMTMRHSAVLRTAE